LFDQAVALPADQRAAFLETACAGDPALRAEVESLLACDLDFAEGAGDDGLLKSPIVRAPGPAAPCPNRSYNIFSSDRRSAPRGLAACAARCHQAALSRFASDVGVFTRTSTGVDCSPIVCTPVFSLRMG
jgi:hypothetical protein